MRKNDRKQSTWLVVLVAGFAVVMSACCFSLYFTGQWFLFGSFLAAAVLLCLCGTIVIVRRRQIMVDLFRSSLKQVSVPNSEFYTSLGIPVVIIRGDTVVWYNTLFYTNVLKGSDLVGELPETLVSVGARSALRVSGKADIEYNHKMFSVYSSEYTVDGNSFTVLYFLDITQYKKLQVAYEQSRNVVVLIAVDSYEEVTADMQDSTMAVLKGAVDREIETFATAASCVAKKLKNNRYFAVMSEAGFSALKNDRFSILDRVRSLILPDGAKVTLSVGVGRGFADLKQSEIGAIKALEMAQGRGGDQAAVNSAGSFEFFGGINNVSVEKRSKVRPRVIAAAIKELISGSENVILMGHRFGDNDSLGSCYALWSCAVNSGKPAHIVVNKDTHLAPNLIHKISRESGEKVFVSPEEALSLVTKNTLLVICDTHRREFLESPELYDRCGSVAMIDHHRKTIDFIQNAIIFYHEPYASSCSEMICEVIQYMSPDAIGRSQAEALLSGIMLDTRDFVLRTGVRTFEAVAYLRRMGADPVAVKELFADSIAVYKERASLVTGAKIHGGYAIALPQDGKAVSRVAASQAADELLSIEGVNASFVLTPISNGVNISARSLGRVNVQLIMEALGGGGHHTMAACQISDVTLEQACRQLVEVIQKITERNVK